MSLMRGDNDRREFCDVCHREIGVKCFSPKACREKQAYINQRRLEMWDELVRFVSRLATDPSNNNVHRGAATKLYAKTQELK